MCKSVQAWKWMEPGQGLVYFSNPITFGKLLFVATQKCNSQISKLFEKVHQFIQLDDGNLPNVITANKTSVSKLSLWNQLWQNTWRMATWENIFFIFFYQDSVKSHLKFPNLILKLNSPIQFHL